MSFDGRVTRLERALGVSEGDWEPTYAFIALDSSALPGDPEQRERFLERIRATLPPSVQTVAWCSDTGHDPAGPHIRLGGRGREEIRPLPDVSGEVEWEGQR